MEYLVRTARITDVDRLVTLSRELIRASGGRGSPFAAGLLRSAHNRGCTVVETVRPEDPGDRDRWNRLWFTGEAPQEMRPVAERAAARN